MPIANPFKGMSKPAVYASLAGFAGIGGYFVYRHHASTGSWNPWSTDDSSAASDTTQTTQLDPVTGLPYSQDDATDPVTGMTYLAEAQQYGSVAAAEADVAQFGTTVASGSGVAVSPATYPVSSTAPGAVAVDTYTSNAAWAQAVQAGLAGVGYDATAVGAALGAYLQGLPLSTAGSPSPYAIVNTAISEYGRPPVGTFQVIQAPPAGPGPASTAKAPAGVTSFSVTPHAGYADFGWSAAASADNYNLMVAGPTPVNRYTGSALNAEHVTLAPGSYTARVRADNHGKLGPWSAEKHFTIQK